LFPGAARVFTKAVRNLGKKIVQDCGKTYPDANFYILTGVNIKTAVFWGMTPCSLLNSYKYFGWMEGE
jgi:hypothetical protein